MPQYYTHTHRHTKKTDSNLHLDPQRAVTTALKPQKWCIICSKQRHFDQGYETKKKGGRGRGWSRVSKVIWERKTAAAEGGKVCGAAVRIL